MPRPAPKLIINLIGGSVAINFAQDSALKLQQKLQELMLSLGQVSNKATSGALPPMEYQHTGEVFLEIFCNPNIWATPFVARVLITLRDERIRLTTEVELSRLIEDLEQYLTNIAEYL